MSGDDFADSSITSSGSRAGSDFSMAERAFRSKGLKASSIANHPHARAPNTTAADFAEFDFPILLLFFGWCSRQTLLSKLEDILLYSPLSLSLFLSSLQIKKTVKFSPTTTIFPVQKSLLHGYYLCFSFAFLAHVLQLCLPFQSRKARSQLQAGY